VAGAGSAIFLHVASAEFGPTAGESIDQTSWAALPSWLTPARRRRLPVYI
jgi:L,D-peptidoglycan transpeptidase YkuD (ErfK/YbiS/YcfS/YnhG family)